MTQNQLIVNQRRSLLIFAERHGVNKACNTFGLSRTTFYKIKKQFIQTGSLEPKIRRKPRMPNETSISKKKILLSLVKEHPLWGAPRLAYALRQKGIQITHQGIWYCLKRFGLNKRFKRLVYIEKLNDQKQPITERSIRLVKKQLSDIKRGYWPGHIVALDTFYVGNIKGVGRIYQMTGIDLCSRFGWADLYTNKEQVSSMNFVETCLLPKFFHNNVDLESVLTDNGSEFIGSKFKQMLGDYNIQHHRIPAGKPMLNGYCERFQRTIYEELYRPIFRKKFFYKLDDLNQELQKYLVFYNFERPHFGLNSLGAIPVNVFKSNINFLRHRFQKLLT